MNWSWANALDQIWRSPTFPMWLTLAVAGFFAIILLVTLLRAEKSVANGALTVITLLAIGVAVAATIRGFGAGGPAGGGPNETNLIQSASTAVPALSCVDDLAGEAVLTACEKSLFGSPEIAAAALSYAASQITRLTAFGDVASVNRNSTPELLMIRRSVERDRYGLMAYVLAARDHCTPSECAAFRSLTDNRQIVANMESGQYDSMISHYAPSWNAPAPPAVSATAAVPTLPTGKPTTADFPSAASTPPVSIMTPEPALAAQEKRPATAAAASPPAAAQRQTSPPTPPQPASKKQAAAKSSRPSAPVQLAPSTPTAESE